MTSQQESFESPRCDGWNIGGACDNPAGPAGLCAGHLWSKQRELVQGCCGLCMGRGCEGCNGAGFHRTKLASDSCSECGLRRDAHPYTVAPMTNEPHGFREPDPHRDEGFSLDCRKVVEESAKLLNTYDIVPKIRGMQAEIERYRRERSDFLLDVRSRVRLAATLLAVLEEFTQGANSWSVK